ncbi:MAG: alanine--glyoxylate aminotransferase family protein [Devosia sp.]|uniref:pyridoxal-phosphate-dependent aminotransferase family protein n=1 Tax=Devosia sp. TaxID=1871048 RepID=UPI002632B6E8|nr:aminotransferase class V-fold PLP-dependent enzyme [Devosia sp.]MDB5529592.1 alanine--glyoxylate aminotransferase family protein [Devosia sp.]
MPTLAPNPLLDLQPFPSEGYADIVDRLAVLLGTSNDVLLVQGEAIVALEAAATSLGQPGLTAINIVTSPYGHMFGSWLRRAGTTVVDVIAEPGLPVTVDAVRSALDANPDARLLALVHAESASGILNALEQIAALARERGILTVIDAVASVGGHALDTDALGLDVVVIGAQKSLGGSPGLSAISISPAAWSLAGHAAAPTGSILSLLDHRRLWLDTGRGALPGMPSALEFWALRAALERVETEGLPALIARHVRAADATRSSLAALGLTPWVAPDHASNLVTAARLPDHLAASQVLAATGHSSGLSVGVGSIAERLVRLNHTGGNASFEQVLANVVALGGALASLGEQVDIGAAAETVADAYRVNRAS